MTPEKQPGYWRATLLSCRFSVQKIAKRAKKVAELKIMINQ
jgi:hypothetical protein